MILSGLVVSTGRTSKDEPKFPWCIVGQLRMSPFSSAAACDLGYTQERTSAPPHGSALSGQPDPPFTDDQKAAYAGALIRAARASRSGVSRGVNISEQREVRVPAAP